MRARRWPGRRADWRRLILCSARNEQELRISLRKGAEQAGPRPGEHTAAPPQGAKRKLERRLILFGRSEERAQVEQNQPKRRTKRSERRNSPNA